ncbi:MAG TPA: hypothetical protein VMX94_04295 [Armatimonadota bacterium]|nr:hypothetical protein [Armatimonadota bacterium]
MGLIQDNQTFRLGGCESRVARTLNALSRQAFSARLWEKDASLWKQGPEGDKVISNRLGWLNFVEPMKVRADEITRFAEEIRQAGFTHAVLMGMGGSSLSPEVSRLTFGVREGQPDLMVLDSTVPAAVLEVHAKIDPKTTLFIVSTKSGTTVETLSAYRYFYERLAAEKQDRAGENFVAITDPGSPLEKEASDKHFRRAFLNFPDIGGRYSALSYFGLAPAAVIGADIKRLLDRASDMAERCSANAPLSENPGVALGAAIAELAMLGRDKLTLILSPEIASFGSWVEQLTAESTGKLGRGIVPVDGELIAEPERYGDDRLFVYLRLDGSRDQDLDARVRTLEEAGHPVIRIGLDDIYDLGKEYFRWEVATAVASALLGVNAFDEPNVKESKDNTSRLLNQFQEKGRLPEEAPILEEAGIKLYCDPKMKAVLDGIRASGGEAGNSLLSYLTAYLDLFQPGNYFALMSFTQRTPAVDCALQCMRGCLRDAFNAATTLGYGPRFLHSTGQLHKGGPNSGIFIQFTADDPEDVPIPGETYGFSTLKQAQALGDAIALRDKGRPLIRLHLGGDVQGGLNKLLDIIHESGA